MQLSIAKTSSDIGFNIIHHSNKVNPKTFAEIYDNFFIKLC